MLIAESALFVSCLGLSGREDDHFPLIIILGYLRKIRDICFQRVHHIGFDFRCAPQAVALFVDKCHHWELCAVSAVGGSNDLVKLRTFGNIKVVCILECNRNISAYLSKLLLVLQLDQPFRVLERTNSLKILTNHGFNLLKIDGLNLFLGVLRYNIKKFVGEEVSVSINLVGLHNNRLVARLQLLLGTKLESEDSLVFSGDVH